MVTSEAHPFAKTGGLAEVAGALPLALARLGHRVTLIVPRYRGLPHTASEQAVLSVGGRAQPVSFSRHRVADQVEAVFVDAPELFDREGLYGTAAGDFADNAWRFAVFSRAALEYARLGGRAPLRAARARLANRSGRRLSEDAPDLRSDRRQRPSGLHHSQSRVSGNLPAGHARRDRSRLGGFQPAGDGILGTDQLSESRDQLQRDGSRRSARPTRTR